MRMLLKTTLILTALLIAADNTYVHAEGSNIPAAMTPPASVPAGRMAGHFRLMTPAGAIVDSGDLAGSPYGLFFGFTHCPDVCPTTLTELTLALAQLPDAKDFRIYFISLDPERDTPRAMAEYTANFDSRIVPLGGERPALEEAIRTFGVVARKFEAGGSYGYAHTASVFLIDGDGLIADSVSYADPASKAAAKIEAVIAGRPAPQ